MQMFLVITIENENQHGALKPFALQVLTNVSISHSAELVQRCGLRGASSNNTCHKLVSGEWVEPLVSSLHTPRRRHQEHGSLERSIRMLETNTIEHKC